MMIQKDTSDKFNAVPKDFVFLDVKKNEADLWNILGRPLEKARKYISDPSQAPKGVKVQRGPKGGVFYETGSTEDKPEKEKPKSNKNWTVVDDVEDLEGQPGIYFRVESYGGAEADVDEMRSVIGSDQIDRECDLCGATMDLDDLEAGCPECGNEASQANRYAKLIDDFDLTPNEEGDYELPGLLAFENHSAAYEYAQNVPGAEIVAYKGDELYHGMQEPDTGWDEFLIDPHTRYRSAANVTKKEKSDADLWNILGRPLEKARKYISDPSKAPKGAKVQRGKKGGYYYEAEPVRTSLKVQPEEVKSAVKDMFSEGMDAKMIASELESKHGIKVHPETVNRFLEREGMEVRPKRETVSRRDVEAQQKTIEEQAKQIEDMSSKLKALKGDVDFYKEKYAALDKENTAMKQEIANLKAAIEALKTGGSETTVEAKPEQEKEPEPPKKETEEDAESEHGAAIDLAEENIQKIYAAGKNWRPIIGEIRKKLRKLINERGENWNKSPYWEQYRRRLEDERTKIYNAISSKRDKQEFDEEYSSLTTKRGAIDKLYQMF